ncbi:MAG: hypothetical protein BMS9Abin24_160 [Thermodesulfobacteriota bacterium]|nr:MAG: hypothetical protein BMS9Abin24_160 [Thermodesulfobacteriota bacterium]
MKISARTIAFTALALAASLSLASCKGNGDKPEAPSTREIIKTYTKTLATAPDKARDAAKASDQRNKAQEEALKGL